MRERNPIDQSRNIPDLGAALYLEAGNRIVAANMQVQDIEGAAVAVVGPLTEAAAIPAANLVHILALVILVNETGIFTDLTPAVLCHPDDATLETGITPVLLDV